MTCHGHLLRYALEDNKSPTWPLLLTTFGLCLANVECHMPVHDVSQVYGLAAAAKHRHPEQERFTTVRIERDLQVVQVVRLRISWVLQ